MDHIVLRVATPADHDWLQALYADVRRDEVAGFGWDAATAQAFVNQQFQAQQRAYRVSHPEARCLVIECPSPADRTHEDPRVGRLWVDRGSECLLVLDISLLSAWRGRGIGTHCLRTLLAEARSTSRAVQLQVLERNPARHLYERLGFEAVDSISPYTAMRWRPAGVTTNLSAEKCHEQT